ncbi:MAG: hypothetical protein ACRBI6_09940 [Acidimicrobiales bacterium]
MFLILAQVVAQADDDNVAQTIDRLILGLLAVAVALAALTIWYWFHTDPRRRSARARAAMGRNHRSPEADAPAEGHDEAIVPHVPATRGVTAPIDASLGRAADTAADDEWLSLTAPSQEQR